MISISSLRVVGDFDSSGYVAGMNAKIAADTAATASSTKLAATIDSANGTMNDNGATLARLSKSYISGWSSAANFEGAIRSLQRGVDTGNVSLAQADPILSGIYSKFGLTADATALAAKGYGGLADVATVVNSRLKSQIVAATGAAAGFDLVGGKLQKAQSSNSGFANAIETTNRQVLALATGLGPTGVILAGFGPWGLAAAAGIALVTAGVESLVAGADDLAKRATSLNAFSQATGLSTDAIQALDSAGAAFGLSSDTVARDVDTLTAAIGAAHDGAGSLFSSLETTNAGLALQLSGVKSVQQGFDLLAVAYQNAVRAGDTAGAANIARAAFGRGGAQAGPALLGSTANAGGIQALGDAAKAAGGLLDANLITPLQKLQAQLDETAQRTKIYYETAYGQQVLEAMLAAAQAQERVAKAVHDAGGFPDYSAALAEANGFAVPPPAPTMPATSGAGVDYGALSTSVAGLAGLGGGEASLTASSAALFAIQQKVIGALAGTATPAQQLQQQLLGLTKAVDDHTLSADQAAKATGLLNEAFDANQLGRDVAAMGALATPTQQYAASLASLKLSLDEGRISQDAFNTGAAALKESMDVTQIQANVSAMGALASPAQQYAAAIAELQLKLDGGRISQYAFAAGALAAKQAMDSSTESIKEQYGLASDSDIASAKITTFNNDMAKIGATAPQVATGMVAFNKSVVNTSDAMAVLRSNTPNFTQLLLDLQNANKTKDELLTSSGNALLQAAPAFVQALQQGDTIAKAIAAALTGAANSIANAFATAGAKNIVGGLTGGATSLFSAASGSGNGTTAGDAGSRASAAGGGSVLSSLLGGGLNLSGLATGGLEMAAGMAISLVTGSIQKDQAAQQAWDQAQAQFVAMTELFAEFIGEQPAPAAADERREEAIGAEVIDLADRRRNERNKLRRAA